MVARKKATRGKSDYSQKKTPAGKKDKGFVEVEQLTQHEDASTINRDDGVAAKELPVAKRYRIEMVEPQNGSSYITMGPRPEHPDQLPDLLTFKFGTIFCTPLYLKPDEARDFAKQFRRAKVPLNVPIHGSKYNEFRTSTREVHRFKVTAEEKKG